MDQDTRNQVAQACLAIKRLLYPPLAVATMPTSDERERSKRILPKYQKAFDAVAGATTINGVAIAELVESVQTDQDAAVRRSNSNRRPLFGHPSSALASGCSDTSTPCRRKS